MSSTTCWLATNTVHGTSATSRSTIRSTPVSRSKKPRRRSASRARTRAAPRMLILDEVQYLADWERHLKAFVDTHPGVKCVVSGSAAAALRLKSVESGAGRFTDFLLPPLTFHEFLDLQGIEDLVEHVPERGYKTDHIEELNRQFVDYLNFGGYPEAVFSPAIRSDPERYIGTDIVDKVLLRDLPSLYGIQDVQELNALFMTLAYNTAAEVSLDALSQQSGVSKPTIRRYLEYLEAAFLIKVVHRVDQNARRFKRANHFKVYVTTPALRCALFGPVAEDDAEMGLLAETGRLLPVVPFPRHPSPPLCPLEGRRGGHRVSRPSAGAGLVRRGEMVRSTSESSRGTIGALHSCESIPRDRGERDDSHDHAVAAFLARGRAIGVHPDQPLLLYGGAKPDAPSLVPLRTPRTHRHPAESGRLIGNSDFRPLDEGCLRSRSSCSSGQGCTEHAGCSHRITPT